MTMLPFENIMPGDVQTPAAYVSVVAADTSTLLYQISPSNTAKIRKIMFTNRTGGNGQLRIGYLTAAAAFVQVLPDIFMVNGIGECVPEDQIPEYWFREKGYNLADIYCQCSVGAAAPTDVQVFVEVFEKGTR